MKTLVIILSLAFILAACGPSSEVIQNAIVGTVAAYTAYPTYTSQPPYSTYTPYPTYTPQPTLTALVLVITATSPPYTATTTPTPTITFTPTITPTPTVTPNSTQTEQARIVATQTTVHEPGFYLVNVDIAPGIWRSSSNLDSCYWARYDRTGEIINNYYGFGGSTIYISPTDFSVELNEDCGVWTYLSPP